MICSICNKSFKNAKGLSSHIRQTHHITSEEYYIRYICSEHSCIVCGKPTKFIDLTHGFHRCCSVKCNDVNPERIEKIITTFKSNSGNMENAKNRRIAYNKSEIGRNNSRKVGKRTGSINIKKAHNRYDTDMWCDTCNKITKHMIGIGCIPCHNRDEKHKEAIKNGIKTKYGKQYENVFQVPEIKEKIKQTAILKYGTSNPGNSRDARIKASQTMRKNGNHSGDEDYFEQQLIELGINYITQYKSDVYPFFCDFYLKDFDIYIELNIYWTHNDHYFDTQNPDDIITLNKWEEKANKGHKQYKNAINVWTKRDILKRDTANKNGLHYIVLWNKTDIIAYVDYLKAICLNQEIEVLD